MLEDEKLSRKLIDATVGIERYNEKTGGQFCAVFDLPDIKPTPNILIFRTFFGKTVRQRCLEIYTEYTAASKNQFQQGDYYGIALIDGCSRRWTAS